jgi:hypothetical protein
LELGGISLDSNPLGGARVSKAPSMAHASTSCACRPTRAFVGTTIVATVADAHEESEDSEPKDDFVAPTDDPISSSGDELDD